MFLWLIVAVGLIGLVAIGISAATVWPRWRLRQQVAELEAARDSFHKRREWLEARFVSLASNSGIPRGLAWVDCDFDDQVAFAREKASGNLRALVAVTIKFEAVDGGGMEDVAAVDNLKAATVVFRYDGGTWQSDGRAIFNLNPAQTIERFHHELESVE